MGRRLVQYTEYKDDIDGSPCTEDSSIEFAIDGYVYTIDLTDVRSKEVREFLAPYQEAAHRKVKVPKGLMPETDKRLRGTSEPASGDGPGPRGGDHVGTMRDRDARRKLRDWANDNGYEVSPMSRIPNEIVLAFHKAHPRTYIPASTLQQALAWEATQQLELENA